ncbi:MAG: hypothetical protein AB8F74_16010 [Saprospiraceae bacterium]
MNLQIRNKTFLPYLFLFFTIIVVVSCIHYPAMPPYYEFIAKEVQTSGGPFIHYIYVGGDYKKGFPDFQDYACRYHSITKDIYPIAGIIFVKSKSGSSKRNKTSVDSEELKKHVLIAFSYDYKQGVEEGSECPPLDGVWIEEFFGLIKRNSK